MTKLSMAVAAGIAAFFVLAAPTLAGNTNGSAGDMPAFYDAQQFTINLKEEPGGAESALLAHNGSINTIYMCDLCEGQVSGGDFVAVLDAIQGDGFNPVWQEVQISFNTGFTPRQLFSDDEISAAAKAGEITLTPTSEVYRCSVVGTPTE